MNRISNLSWFTKGGLILAFFGPALALLVFKSIEPTVLTNRFVMARELSLFLLLGFLAIIIHYEKLEISSIGLHGRHWGKSIAWSLLLVLIFVAVILGCLGLLKVIGVLYGANDNKYDAVSLWLITIMTIRAGVLEEVFYRGYIMERLSKISDNWLVFLLFPSVVFGLMHYRQGIGGIFIATISGLVLSLFYWKKRDLKINIMAHFMVDFIPNVLIPLIDDGV